MKASSFTHLFTYSTIALLIGLLAGEKYPAVLSISMLVNLLSLIGLCFYVDFKKVIWNEKGFLLLSASVIGLLVNYLYSDNFSYLNQRLQIKLPIFIYALLWPVALIVKVQLKDKIGIGVIVAATISATGILINYALHFDEVNQMYLESKIMPGPIHHIRFSLFTVFAVYLCYYYWKKFKSFNNKFYQYFLYAGVFLIIFLHIYSVRSGLLTLYLVILLCMFNFLYQTKNIKKFFISGLVLTLIAAASFLLSPTLRNKVTNTKEDIAVYQAKANPNFQSIATRFASYETGLALFKRSPIWGVGLGDLQDENTKLFRLNYPSIVTPIIPHNQFLFYLAATGLIGFFIFTITFLAPLFINKRYKSELIQVAYFILLVAFQFEAMLETQIGIATTVIILFISFLVQKSEPAKV